MSKPVVYIPTLRGSQRLALTLAALAAQSEQVDVVVADNSGDGAAQATVEPFGAAFHHLRLEANLGFGRALNRAVEAHPGDPVILLNDDATPEERFTEALLEAGQGGDASVAAVLLTERDPSRIDSAGVIADRTLMGFDYLNGEPVSKLAGAAAPLGPTGGAALYPLAAYERVGGFDERIFLYYEDLDLSLRMRIAGLDCRLAPEARAVHAYSETLGARSGSKYERTGWSRSYLLRRYGVMRSPRSATRVLALEGAICAGQILRDRTIGGLRGRVRGWRENRGAEVLSPPQSGLLDMTAREALELRRRRHSG